MKALAKKDVPGLLLAWSRQYRVLGPCATGQGDVIFSRFSPDGFTLSYGKPAMPPKALLLPQSEVLFTVAGGAYAEAPPPANPALLFGIRACDAMGLAQAKSFFERDCTDGFFSRRAADTLTVVNACAGPQNGTCFCATMKSGPWARSGFDLQLYDAGDAFIVEEGSERAARLTCGGFFTDIGAAEAAGLVRAFKGRAESAIPPAAAVPRAMELLTAGQPCDAVWERLGKKCIVCGGCAYVCPTCTCFTVTDRVRADAGGERIRSWDACLFSGFTREASGHNPRPTQAARLKRRHEHKLRYFSRTDAQDMLCGCVGCGRCSDFCPVHIGTLEVASAIAGKTG